MIGALINALRDAGLEADDIELADALWLALAMPGGQSHPLHSPKSNTILPIAALTT